MRVLVEWFSCFLSCHLQGDFVRHYSFHPSPLFFLTLLCFSLFHLCALSCLIINHPGWDYGGFHHFITYLFFSEMTLRLFFFSLYPVCLLFPLSLCTPPSPPAFHLFLIPPSQSLSQLDVLMLSAPPPTPPLCLFFSLSRVCQIVSPVNGSPVCYWSRAVWLAHNIPHMGHFMSWLVRLAPLLLSPANDDSLYLCFPPFVSQLPWSRWRAPSPKWSCQTTCVMWCLLCSTAMVSYLAASPLLSSANIYGKQIMPPLTGGNHQ